MAKCLQVVRRESINTLALEDLANGSGYKILAAGSRVRTTTFCENSEGIIFNVLETFGDSDFLNSK